MSQLSLIPTRPRGQLLKWIGNKQKHANVITSFFPDDYNRYIEPFVGAGPVLATLAPKKGIAGDILTPLIDLWRLVQKEPHEVIDAYSSFVADFDRDRKYTYQDTLQRYNKSPNALDLLFISRTCYGGVVRFTREGKMSTPIGPHNPIRFDTFSCIVFDWCERLKHVTFVNQTFTETLSITDEGDLIYCDPPYVDSQSILYGAQTFSFATLIHEIHRCKKRGARIALSIDGKKKSGKKTIRLEIPPGLFEREVFLDCGSSMLKRLQNGGKTMIGEDVQDRLLLTW